MSAKLRMTLWVTLMVLLLCLLVLVFVLVLNSRNIAADPARYLVDVVLENADDVEFDNGRFDWHDLHVCRRGVYCSFYNSDEKLLLSANPEELDLSPYPFRTNVLRSITSDGKDYYLYDAYVDMTVSGLWIRGVVSTENNTGVMHTITVLTVTLLPLLLALTFGGSLLISHFSFRPMEKIVEAANSISDGNDLSERIRLTRGPKEFRMLSQAFDRMFERLERDFQAERQFASDASHELRTPTTVILAECDRARRKDREPEDYQKSLAVIEEQGKHMSDLIQQLLTLTRMQHGVDRYPLREANLSVFTAACCEEFQPVNDRGIRLETDISEDITASFNPALLSRIIFNLLQNAYQYGRENGSILLSLRQEDGRAVLRVRDDGIGIAPEDREKIWQRFWQADPARNDGSGSSGLGLSMVREIAEFHGGSASVESKPGEGSTFTVTI